MNTIKLENIYEKLDEMKSLEYVNNRAIIVFKKYPVWHIKMPRPVFLEIENKFYENALSKIETLEVPKEYKCTRTKAIDIDTEKLKELYRAFYKNHEMAEYFNCGIGLIQNLVSELIKNGELERRKFFNQKALFVIENYGKLTQVEMADILGLKVGTVYELVWRLKKQGVIKVEEQ
ncbi:MAG: MarR family transcriptional regulator [Cetobacterium sp.]|uniref:MarR family transcriptional regulator n=1 Tax=Cetobacterium sp. TaxID=2071632 RepID=UPI003F3ABD45